MRVFIPLKNGQKDHTELRFAIRSMVKHFKSMTGLIIVGEKPSWYKGDHIFEKDQIGVVDFNMYRKLMKVKGETVLYTNDDIFALQPFDENLPNYACGTCGEKALTTRSGKHRKQYKNCDPEWYHFDIHCPIVIDTNKFNWPEGKLMPIKSAYAGSLGLPATPLLDNKFDYAMTLDEIRERNEGRPFFSTSHWSMNGDMIKYLHETYPEKSIYE